MNFSLQAIDYIAILVYFILMAGIGMFFGRHIKDASAYLKGSGTVPWMIAGISNFMGLFSTFVFVAYAGIAYEHGIIAVTVMWSTIPACLFAAIFMAKRWRRTHNTSPVEYLETRYNAPLRQIVAWGGLLMRLLDNMIRLYAIGIFLTVVTPMNLTESIIISGIIVTVFTLMGGLWAVTVMGTVQFIILVLTTVILLPLSLEEVGGFAAITDKIPEHLDWFNGPKGAPLWLIIYYLMIVIKYNENWTFVQRFFCVRDEKAAVKVSLLTGTLFLIFPLIFLLPAIAARLVFPELPDKEMAYVAISAKLLPPGLIGVMVASMFAATMSTLNAEYNAVSSVVTTDFFKRIVRPNASQDEVLKVARISTVLIGTIILVGGIFIADFGGAFEANKLFTGIFAIPIGIPYVMGLLVKRPSSAGAIITIFIGAISGIVLNMLPHKLSWELATLFETIICIFTYILSGYIFKENLSAKKKKEEFFTLLTRPIDEHEKPNIEAGFKKALSKLFIISLAVSGSLFIGIALPSLYEQGSKLSILAGIICLLAGAGIFVLNRKATQSSSENVNYLKE